jgi:hypothetical protein
MNLHLSDWPLYLSCQRQSRRICTGPGLAKVVMRLGDGLGQDKKVMSSRPASVEASDVACLEVSRLDNECLSRW